MTALSAYQKLEAPGLWRAHPGDQRREVLLALGDATLVVYDPAGRPLAHWSLAALERLNPGQLPALFRAGADSSEELEVTDPELLQAIERVGRALDQAKAHPGRLRIYLRLAVFALVAAALVWWLPKAMIRHAATVVPEVKRVELGRRLLGEVQRYTGPPCQSPLGDAALRVLHTRLAPGPGALLVVPAGIKKAAHLPGGIILLNRALVEDFEDPNVVAGYVLAERARREALDPVEALLSHAGAFATFRLLTTGDVAPEALAAYSEALITAAPRPVPDRTLLDLMQETGVPASPYAYGEDITGERTFGLIEADQAVPDDLEPVLRDSAWPRLQGICGA